MTDVKRSLKKLAEAATPGPWYQELYHIDGTNEAMPHIHNEDQEIASTTYRRNSHDQHIVDATYIAAANPEAVLGLIERIERLEAALELSRSDVCWILDRHDVPLLNDVLGTICEALKEET